MHSERVDSSKISATYRNIKDMKATCAGHSTKRMELSRDKPKRAQAGWMAIGYIAGKDTKELAQDECSTVHSH